MSSRNAFSRFVQGLVDVIYPRHCSVCGTALASTEAYICTSCLYALPRVDALSFTENPFVRTFWGLFPVDKGTAFFYYRKGSDYRRLLFDLKYNRQPHLGVALGRIMARRLQEQQFFTGIDGLIPVPLSAARRRRRGYNQSEQIARGVSAVTGLPVWSRTLIRTVDNPTQTRLHRSERQANVDDIFRLTNSDGLSGKHLLLIDDVMTTGATISACGETLARIPGVRISVLTLAWTGDTP